MRVSVTISMPLDLVHRLPSENRSAFVVWALEQALSSQGEPGGQVVSQSQGRSPGVKPIERGSTPRSPDLAADEPESSPANPGTPGRVAASAAPAAPPYEKPFKPLPKKGA